MFANITFRGEIIRIKKLQIQKNMLNVGTYDSCEYDARGEANNAKWTSGFTTTGLYSVQLNKGACPHYVTHDENVA